MLYLILLYSFVFVLVMED